MRRTFLSIGLVFFAPMIVEAQAPIRPVVRRTAPNPHPSAPPAAVHRQTPTHSPSPAAGRPRSRLRLSEASRRSHSPEAIRGAEALAVIMEYRRTAQLQAQQSRALVSGSPVAGSVRATEGIAGSLPQPPNYGFLGLPGNYYQPSIPSSLPYSTTNGYSDGTGFPVYSLQMASPNGGVATYAQSSLSQPSAANNLYYQAGYAGYTAPSAYYSYGRTAPIQTSPSYVGYSNSGVSNPGLGNFVSPQPGRP